MEGVACRNSQRFSTNIKAGHEFEQSHLEAEFGQSKFSDLEFVSKSYDHFTKPPLS
jgi:hypothetical protein